MRAELEARFAGAMRGRTMYVVPFSMGPVGGADLAARRAGDGLALRGASMAIMTRMGAEVLAAIGPGTRVGARRAHGRHAARRRATATALPDVAVAVERGEDHRPLPRDAGDLVLRLRLRRQRAAREEVLRAAHRLGDGARGGLARRAHAARAAHLAGRAARYHIAAAFPSACGKTNFAMLTPTGPAGRSRRSATTSPGCDRAPTAGCGRSTRRPGSSASRPAPARRRTRPRWRRCARTRSSRTSR